MTDISIGIINIMDKKKLYIVMVGLPARGKSTIANRLKENLINDSINTKIFNNGDLRRQLIPTDTSFAHFYSSDNKEGAATREKIAYINMEKAKDYLNHNGVVAIMDATNTSFKRRQMILKYLNDHPVLFIECINEDTEILDESIHRKVEKPEFSHIKKKEAFKSFKDRIINYMPAYSPLLEERNFVKVDSLNNKIIDEKIYDTIPYYEFLRDLLVTDTIKNLFLIRHGETYFNLENRIGGDSDLTANGKLQARALAEYFQDKEIPQIFTSKKKRTMQTAAPIRKMQKKCKIFPLEEFNEIDSGICECMSYEEIRKEMPHVHATRKGNKYNYIYPEGEGYVTMDERITRGIKKALYLSDTSKNIMIIGHRAANRMILSHFLFKREEDVPYIYVPQDKFYYISVDQNKKLFELTRFQ